MSLLILLMITEFFLNHLATTPSEHCLKIVLTNWNDFQCFHSQIPQCFKIFSLKLITWSVVLQFISHLSDYRYVWFVCCCRYQRLFTLLSHLCIAKDLDTDRHCCYPHPAEVMTTWIANMRKEVEVIWPNTKHDSRIRTAYLFRFENVLGENTGFVCRWKIERILHDGPGEA